MISTEVLRCVPQVDPHDGYSINKKETIPGGSGREGGQGSAEGGGGVGTCAGVSFDLQAWCFDGAEKYMQAGAGHGGVRDAL